MKTINGKTDGFIGEDKIYIGRYNRYYNLSESPLHNPFAIVKGVNTRKDVINQYKLHAIKAEREVYTLSTKKGKLYKEDYSEIANKYSKYTRDKLFYSIKSKIKNS